MLRSSPRFGTSRGWTRSAYEIRDAINLVHDIGTYLNASALRRAKFKAIQNDLIQQKRICIDDVIDPESIAKNVDFDQSDEDWPNERNVNKKTYWLSKALSNTLGYQNSGTARCYHWIRYIASSVSHFWTGIWNQTISSNGYCHDAKQRNNLPWYFLEDFPSG